LIINLISIPESLKISVFCADWQKETTHRLQSSAEWKYAHFLRNSQENSHTQHQIPPILKEKIIGL
jgi:hypothetical protein